jgi:hypothetical protein
MKVLLAVDDTDNLESIGTGHLAEAIAQEVEKNGWGKRSYITRHQLLVHPDVPYTSHNSSMCFTADIGGACLDLLIDHAARFLEKASAPGSDPGLCVAVADRLEESEELVAFGRRAKQTVVKKSEAQELARRLGIHLSEHGGTGGGMIGALAAVGLRLSGNDGRVRGHLQIDSVNGVARVRDICTHPDVGSVQTLQGEALHDDEAVLLSGWKVKAVLQGGGPVLLVVPTESEGPRWRTCSKEILKAY